MNAHMTVGGRIRLVRQSCDMTQRELGKRAGIAEPTIRRYEIGSLNPKYETLLKIAKALNCNVQFLLDGSVAVNVADGVMEKLCDELARWCAEGNRDEGQPSSYVSMVNGAIFVLHRLEIPCKVQWRDGDYHFASVTVAGKTVCVDSAGQDITTSADAELPDIVITPDGGK